MEGRIPFNTKQILPLDWEKHLPEESKLKIPTVEQLYKFGGLDGVNTKALTYAAMHCLSTVTIPTLSLISAASFNTVLLFHFEFPIAYNEKPTSTSFKIVARIPKNAYRIAGGTASTAAMMCMARHVCKIPCPEIFAWYPDADNPVGAPYILMEYIEGFHPWWPLTPTSQRVAILAELAKQHAQFARSLPYKGFGSVFFAEKVSEDREPVPNDPSSYRIGPLILEPTCVRDPGETSQPLPLKNTHTTLRELWMDLWQHEVDQVMASHGGLSDHSAIILRISPGLFPGPDETYTAGEFLDHARLMRTLILKCPLVPTDLQTPKSLLEESSIVMTDYALRNVILDPDTKQVKAFIDWDDIYILPPLLCSHYLQDICCCDGAPRSEWGIKTGGFCFLPPDTEGQLTTAEVDIIHFGLRDTVGGDHPQPVGSDEPDDEIDATSSQISSDCDDNASEPSRKTDPRVHDTTYDGIGIETDPEIERESNRVHGIHDTRLRRQYEQFVGSHDQRFSPSEFWKTREDPLKIQWLLLPWMDILDIFKLFNLDQETS